jgi:acetyltransferase-like isoleucine patch superfamily enzyme
MIGYRIDALRGRLAAAWMRGLGVRIGPGARIYPGARVRCGHGRGRIGERSILYRNVQVLCTGRGSFSIGRDSHVAPYGYVLVGEGALEIGDRVAIGPYCGIFCQSNGAAGGTPFVEQLVVRDVHIGSNVFIGTKATILPGAYIEDDVVVAAHAVVRGRLASGWVYGGAPAVPLKKIGAP